MGVLDKSGKYINLLSSLFTILMALVTVYNLINSLFNIIEFILLISILFICIFLTIFIRNKNLCLRDKSIILLSIAMIAILSSTVGYAAYYYQDYKIVVDYNGSYTMGYGSDFTHDDTSSSGHKEFNLNQSSYINVGAKKSDGSDGKLNLSIMRGNRVIEKESTTDPYGEVIIHFKE
ncbi:hypothetical protein MBCUT_06410 [Methanobrevibacter cuticularis]|uniref:Uncharacterized protein n=1 Tax=Methanobrevibacter cuticularis TaxID=47311 RepID=A0A166CTW3_9EURY|nr:hypothetical protein [Methanobrevibacter cuticularis]KZX16777.1 hypothetical protein MBCUT_06410 [Methanobrevibacter cuticularis]